MTMNMKLGVNNLPASDVDRAKRFYQELGWRMDGDFVVGEDFRASSSRPRGHSARSPSAWASRPPYRARCRI